MSMSMVDGNSHVLGGEAQMRDAKLPPDLDGAVAGAAPVTATEEMLRLDKGVSNDLAIGNDGRELVWVETLLERPFEGAKVKMDRGAQDLLQAIPVLPVVAVSPLIGVPLNLEVIYAEVSTGGIPSRQAIANGPARLMSAGTPMLVQGGRGLECFQVNVRMMKT